MPSFWAGVKDRVVISYIIDYVLICSFIVFFSSLDKMEPFHQKFSLHNWTLQYPFAEHERIPAWMAGIISCAFPLLIIILYALVIDGAKKVKKGNGLYVIHPMKERLWEMNCGILGLGLSVAAVIFFTGALKNAIGKPRPDMLARCQPPEDAVDPLPFGLSDYSICTGDKHILKDGFKSFPSGHSSTAFAGLGYLSIYLAGKLHVLDNRGEVWKTVIVVIPLIAASLVAGSRIMDARHHPFDVLFGSAMGLLFAWASYRQYFPALSDTTRHGKAYPMRTWGTKKGDDDRINYDRTDSYGLGVHDEEAVIGSQTALSTSVGQPTHRATYTRGAPNPGQDRIEMKTMGLPVAPAYQGYSSQQGYSDQRSMTSGSMSDEERKPAPPRHMQQGGTPYTSSTPPYSQDLSEAQRRGVQLEDGPGPFDDSNEDERLTSRGLQQNRI